MKPGACAVSLLLICCVCLHRVGCRLPDVTPATPPLQVTASVTATAVSDGVTSLQTDGFRRLPGLCRRLKRRRVTVLCNLQKFCWRGRSQDSTRGRGQKVRSGQVCRCPRGSRCSHFFVHSL